MGSLVLGALAIALMCAVLLGERGNNPRLTLLIYFALLFASSTLGACYFLAKAFTESNTSGVKSTLAVVIALCLAFFAVLGALAFWRLRTRGPGARSGD